MSMLDLIVLLVLILAVARGLMRGLVDTLFSLVATLGILAAGILYSLWKTRNDQPEVPKPAE